MGQPESSGFCNLSPREERERRPLLTLRHIHTPPSPDTRNFAVFLFSFPFLFFCFNVKRQKLLGPSDDERNALCLYLTHSHPILDLIDLHPTCLCVHDLWLVLSCFSPRLPRYTSLLTWWCNKLVELQALANIQSVELNCNKRQKLNWRMKSEQSINFWQAVFMSLKNLLKLFLASKCLCLFRESFVGHLRKEMQNWIKKLSNPKQKLWRLRLALAADIRMTHLNFKLFLLPPANLCPQPNLSTSRPRRDVPVFPSNKFRKLNGKSQVSADASHSHSGDLARKFLHFFI